MTTPTNQQKKPVAVLGSAVESRIAETVANQRGEDADGRRALAVPYPGAAADAFAVPDSIVCGQWRVRPMFDADFDTLKALENPMYELIVLDIADEKNPTPAEKQKLQALEDSLVRGRHAWNLFYVMTRDAQDVEDSVQSDGGVELHKAARREFGHLQQPGLVALHRAVLEQFRRYTGVVVSYEPAGGEEDEEGGRKRNPSESSAAPSTG